MPNGIVIMHWDERIGAEIIASHPKGTRIEERTLMQVYAQHEYSGEAGFISLSVGTLNLTSYFTGPETNVYIVLLMDIDEDAFEYEEILIDVGRQVLETMDNPETLKALLPNYFQRICAFPTLSGEQKLALFFQNEVKRLILERFRNEVAIPRSELDIWIKDKYKKAVSIDLDGILDRMIKLGLIKYASVKGSASDMIFFVQDIMMLRHPPEELVKDPTSHHLPRSLKKAYIEQVQDFFKDYKVDFEDNMKVMDEIL